MEVENYKDRLIRFKTFGKLKDESDRVLIADFLENWVVENQTSIPKKELSDRGRHVYHLLSEVLYTPGLQRAAMKHVSFREEVVKDLLDFADDQSINDFHFMPKKRKFQWSLPLFFFLKGNQSNQSGKGRKRKKGKNFLQRLWDKLTKGQFSKKRISKDLSEKAERIEQAQEALTPIYQVLGVSYGQSEGIWRKVGFTPLKAYGDFLAKSKELQALSELLGRFQSLDSEEMNENLAEVEMKPYRTTLQKGKEELIGIHESNDLAHLLPSEASLLGNSTTKLLFYKKYAEKKLQTYELKAANKHYEQKKAPQKRKSDQLDRKGPIIICIDSSASMMGKPELLAKTMTLALTRKSLEDKRPCYLISFSKGVQTLSLHDLSTNAESLLAFLSMSFRGGTDVTLALEECIAQLNKEQYTHADILLLSDGKIPEFEVFLKHKIRVAQQKGNKFYSIFFSINKEQPIKEFDQNWNCHPNRLEDLRQVIDYMKKNKH